MRKMVEAFKSMLTAKPGEPEAPRPEAAPVTPKLPVQVPGKAASPVKKTKTEGAMAGTRDLFAKLEQEISDKPIRKGKASVEPKDAYDESSIEVLEGLEPVRRRPGMFIGGTDEKALHHLFAEVLDNAMDEAVAGHATFIEVRFEADGYLSVSDNGRGIPVGPHPKFKSKSTLEVIMTMLHSGGKFGSDAYKVSGGLHGVGVSVVNALSEHLEVEVARNQQLCRQSFRRGQPDGGLEQLGPVKNRRGTKVRFKPDPTIFKDGATFKPARLLRMARSKAYLFGGVEIRWFCDPSLIKDDTPSEAVFHFPGGLKEFLGSSIGNATQVTKDVFAGKIDKGGHGNCEWAITWLADQDGFLNSYCNTVPTAEGGTHEAGFRSALTKGLKAYAELTGNKKAGQITAEDVLISSAGMLSVFIREPEFQGQTKDKLATQEAQRLVETVVRDSFDHFLADSPQNATRLLEWVIERAEERLKRKREKEVSRQSATRKLRLPGKLADCAISEAAGTEIFIVEGDSAGGSAKTARNRENQAILPLRGKILNVANATSAKLSQNQLLGDLIQALGVGTGSKYRDEDLRYEKVIVMTDADVDGAHIASLLITFFYQEMPELIEQGHLYLAVPPLYRLTHGGKSIYARDDAAKERALATTFKNKKVEISRFKGLGEMDARDLKSTTMDPANRLLLKVEVVEADKAVVAQAVSDLMGSKPEARFRFISERAAFAKDLDI